jgi:hypothetical protein
LIPSHWSFVLSWIYSPSSLLGLLLTFHFCTSTLNLQGGFGLGMHIPGMPVADWTTACGVIQEQQPALFAAIVVFISIAEGESVGHSGDSFRGKSTKVPGNLGFDVSTVCYGK